MRTKPRKTDFPSNSEQSLFLPVELTNGTFLRFNFEQKFGPYTFGLNCVPPKDILKF